MQMGSPVISVSLQDAAKGVNHVPHNTPTQPPTYHVVMQQVSYI